MERLIRIKEVMHITGLARSTVWLWMKEGRLPASHKMSPKVTVWKESEIVEFINNVA